MNRVVPGSADKITSLNTGESNVLTPCWIKLSLPWTCDKSVATMNLFLNEFKPVLVP